VHHLFRRRCDDRPAVRWNRRQKLDGTWIGDYTKSFFIGECIELRKVSSYRFIREGREILPDGVDCTTAMRSTQIKVLAEAIVRSPAHPASFIAMGGPYEYTVHVEQQAGDSYLDLNRGMNLSCTRVHRARVSACTSLLQLIVGEEFRLLRCDIVPVQIRKPRLPFLD
jgi:hypothetical protein